MTTRYGLIGAGMMGQEHIRNLALLEGTELAAVADPNSTMREQSRQLAGPACVGYEHHQQMLAAEKLDALVVASPNHTHHPVLSDVLDAGLPILCEKPLGISQSECADLEKKVADAGVPLWVAMEYRYMPPVQRLLDELHAGSVGHIHMLSIREHRYPFLEKVGNWNRYEETSGGTMVEKCCHFFDLMRLILQSEPTRVYASGALNVNHQDETHLDQPADVIDN
ncbi:MAG: Gfo/Idh/MocA family oxidoreductase, partial [Pseudomonadota bacterium]